jgi:hypothetical protein
MLLQPHGLRAEDPWHDHPPGTVCLTSAGTFPRVPKLNGAIIAGSSTPHIRVIVSEYIAGDRVYHSTLYLGKKAYLASTLPNTPAGESQLLRDRQEGISSCVCFAPSLLDSNSLSCSFFVSRDTMAEIQKWTVTEVGNSYSSGLEVDSHADKKVSNSRSLIYRESSWKDRTMMHPPTSSVSSISWTRNYTL